MMPTPQADTAHADEAASYRVLIVDDDPIQRALSREILAHPKYEVTEAANGEEALAAVRAQPFDALLLDIYMPRMDGHEVCRRIRGELGEALLPIIVVTGHGGQDDLATSLRVGANDFVRKPYHPVELISRLDAAVRQKRLTDQLDSAESMLFTLARMVEAKDSYTGDHCTRLAHSAVAFGEALGLGREDLLALRRGGVLHDIGKLGVPERILLKPGPLDEAEFAAMREHTLIGERICQGLKSMRPVLPIIRSHHERWDGSGYPDGLAGEAIPLLARVFQIVDIHDALCHERPYKPALPRDEVIRILAAEAERGWSDPELMAVFLDILHRRPENLRMPPDMAKGLGEAIYADIAGTCVLQRAVAPPVEAGGRA